MPRRRQSNGSRVERGELFEGVEERCGRFYGMLGVSHEPRVPKIYSLGSWSTPRAAAIARDRAILFFALDRPLQVPRQSRRLGPASPEQLRKLALQESRRQSGRSGKVGVSHDRRYARWNIQVNHAGAIYIVHGFGSEREAIIARDRMELYFKGAQAWRNLPHRKLTPASPEALKAALAAERKQLPPGERPRRGVYWQNVSPGRPWFAQIWFPSGEVYLCGTWTSSEAAAIAYDRAALYYFGEEAQLNFPRRRSKLEPASAEELRREAFNEKKQTTSSIYRGVSWSRREKRWKVEIGVEGRRVHVGTFMDEVEAAHAYDEAARKYRGRQALLNFQDEPPPERRPRSVESKSRRPRARSDER